MFSCNEVLNNKIEQMGVICNECLTRDVRRFTK